MTSTASPSLGPVHAPSLRDRERAEARARRNPLVWLREIIVIIVVALLISSLLRAFIIQVFQGVVIARRGHGVSATFTIRKVSFGVGVERTFPVHAPTIDHIEVVTKGDVRRAKLYYLRERHGKAAKIKEHRSGKAE